MPVRCNNTGKIITALIVCGTGFLWSFTREVLYLELQGDESTVPNMERNEKNQALHCKEKCRREIFQLGSYKTLCDWDKHNSVKQLPTSLNFTWKSKTIISVKTIKCNMGITYKALVDQFKCPRNEFLPLSLSGRSPCRRTWRRT